MMARGCAGRKPSLTKMSALRPLLLAQAPRERLQRRRHDLRARRLGRFRIAAHEVALELGARRVVAGMSFERRDHLADEGAILREGNRMQWIERLDQRDHVAVAKERVDQMGQRRTSADCGVACPYVKLVEKDPDDAPAARLQLHGLDHARFAGVGQLEIAGLQILDGPRLRVGDDDIEGHRFVRVLRLRRRSLECIELWRDYGQARATALQVTRRRPRRRSISSRNKRDVAGRAGLLHPLEVDDRLAVREHRLQLEVLGRSPDRAAPAPPDSWSTCRRRTCCSRHRAAAAPGRARPGPPARARRRSVPGSRRC